METILIIDDDVAIGNLEQEVLEREGYLVQRAYSGTEALWSPMSVCVVPQIGCVCVPSSANAVTFVMHSVAHRSSTAPNTPFRTFMVHSLLFICSSIFFVHLWT